MRVVEGAAQAAGDAVGGGGMGEGEGVEFSGDLGDDGGFGGQDAGDEQGEAGEGGGGRRGGTAAEMRWWIT